MTLINLAIVAPSAQISDDELEQASIAALERGFRIVMKAQARATLPAFLNGSHESRLAELVQAENINADALWAARGGVGALELWDSYKKDYYVNKKAVLIGYSDITVYHFMRFYRANRIGIHAANFNQIDKISEKELNNIKLLVNKQAKNIIYPPLKALNNLAENKLLAHLLPMNLSSLQSLVGAFDKDFLAGKILALEDINEAPYKVFRALLQLKNAGLLDKIKAIIIGDFNNSREIILYDIFKPLCDELLIPLFDWPFFGHQDINWPLLFGARLKIEKKTDEDFFLSYQEEHDHSS
jgi:muramoyltetrapeptide carboxypeptidase